MTIKKILFLCISAAILSGCASKSYKLEGKANGINFDGVVISLSIFDGENWNKVEETTAADNKFLFTGNTEEPVMAVLAFNDREKQLRGSKAFILENAAITFQIDADQQISMKGTKQNDLIQSFENDLNGIVSQQLKDSIDNNLFSEAELEQIYEQLDTRQNKIISDFSKANINTLPGTLIFMKTYYSISLEDKSEIIGLMDDNTKNNHALQSIIRQTETEKRVAAGQPYTDFRLPDTQGSMISLSELVGKTDYVLIDFWASWCGPCIRSFPELTKFYEKYKGTKFEILGVSLDNDEDKWKFAIEHNHLAWKHVSDLKGWKSEAGQLYAVNSIPATILIDKQGRIVGRGLSLARIEELLK